MAAPTSIIDTRVIGRPERFSGLDKDWNGFHWDFVNFMGAINSNLPTYLNTSEKAKVKIEMAPLTPQDRELGKQVYYVLSNLVKAKAKKYIKRVKEFNGWEAWRLLCVRYQPQGLANRSTGLFQAILAFQFDGKVEELEEGILQLEDLIKEYEEQTNDKVPDHLMRGLVIKGLPERLQEYVTMRAGDFDTFDKLRQHLVDYIYARKGWKKKTALQDGDGMDIGRIGYGNNKGKNDKGGWKGKGKGKFGKGKGKFGGKQQWNNFGGKGGKQQWNWGGGGYPPQKHGWKGDAYKGNDGKQNSCKGKSFGKRYGKGFNGKDQSKGKGDPSWQQRRPQFQGYCAKPYCRKWGHKASECRTPPPQGYQGQANMEVGAIKQRNNNQLEIQDGSVNGVAEQWVFQIGMMDDDFPTYEECDDADADVCYLCVESESSEESAELQRCSWCLNNFRPKHFKKHMVGGCRPEDLCQLCEEPDEAEDEKSEAMYDQWLAEQIPVRDSSDEDLREEKISDSTDEDLRIPDDIASSDSDLKLPGYMVAIIDSDEDQSDDGEQPASEPDSNPGLEVASDSESNPGGLTSDSDSESEPPLLLSELQTRELDA